MRQMAIFIILGFVAVSFLSLGVKVVLGLGHLVLVLVLLPFKILGFALSLLVTLLSLPFQLLGWLMAALGLVFGLLLLPLLPLVVLSLVFLGLGGGFRRRFRRDPCLR